MDEEERLIRAIESVRRDKANPWRYLTFTFVNGIAWGLGMALGMTVILGMVIYVMTRMISGMVDFPVIGEYIQELGNLIEAYSKAAPRVR